MPAFERRRSGRLMASETAMEVVRARVVELLVVILLLGVLAAIASWGGGGS